MIKNPSRKRKTNNRFNLLDPRVAIVIALVSLFALAWLTTSRSAPVLAGDNQQREFVEGRDMVAGEVLVKFRSGATEFSVFHAGQDADADVNEQISASGIRLLHSRSKNVATLVRELSARNDVEYAEPNYIVHAIATPNDPRYPELWGLNNTGQTVGGVVGTPGADIKAPLAWDISTGGTTTVVGVIDTGIDYNHPDLLANVWSAPTSFSVTVGGTVINCAAGTHGFNAITNTCNPIDDNDHGSHCSGTIGGSGNNGVGVAGVNWTASIMGLKFLDASGSGSTANAIKAIDFAIQTKNVFGASANVRVLSNSWGGGGFSQALLDAINRSNTSDMLFVAAAGNNGTNNDTTPHYPSSYNAPNIVAVAATDNRDALASFSNYGATSVHLGAPGVNVLSTTRNNTYSSFSGTSMATPHVSGAAALVLSVCALNTANLKTNLMNNTDPIASLSGRTVTGGRLNVNKAIRACSAPPTPDFSLSTTPSSVTVTQGATANYTENVTRTGGFTGSVSLSISGLPAGAAGTFTPNPNTGATSALAITTSASTPAGSYVFTVTGTSTSPALTRTSTATLVVQAPATPDFSLSTTPASVTVTQGATANYTENVTRTGGFTGSVSLSISGLPAGAAGTFTPNPNTGATSALAITTSTTTPAGSYVFTVTGTSTSPALTRTSTATLVVQAPGAGNFTLAITPASRTVNPGQGTTYTINITRTSFTGAVSLSVSGLGTGAGGTFSPNPATANSSTLTVTTTTAATPGTRTFTVTGTSGTLTRTATATLVVSNCVNGNGNCQ